MRYFGPENRQTSSKETDGNQEHSAPNGSDESYPKKKQTSRLIRKRSRAMNLEDKRLVTIRNTWKKLKHNETCKPNITLPQEDLGELADVHARLWYYKVHLDKGSPMKVLVPSAYCGDLSKPPIYKTIKQEDYVRERIRDAPKGLIRTSIKSDKFGMVF